MPTQDLISVARKIVANLPKSSILIFDTQMRYVFAGGEELEKQGFDTEAMLGKTLYEVLTPDRVAFMEPNYIRALNKEKFQIKLARDYATYLVTFSHIEFGADNALYGIAIIQNITDLVKTEKLLEEQKELYENVLQGISAGVWYWPNMENRQQQWSERYYQLLGYNYNEMEPTMDNFVAHIHPDDRDKAFAIQTEHYTTQSTFYIEYRIQTKNAGYRWFLVTGKVMLSEEGRPKSMLGSIIDIDDRKKAEQEVIDAETKLASIFNNSFELIGLLSPDGKMIEANNIALEFFNVSANDAKGVYLWDFGANLKSDLVRAQQKEAVAKAAAGQTVRLELNFTRNGKNTYQDFSLKPITDEQGNIVHLIVETRDITDMVMARKNLEEQKFQLENFAYITSHNLRAPAANISMLVEMLGFIDEPAERQQLLNQISISSKKLIDTINVLAQIVKIRKETSLPIVANNLQQVLNGIQSQLSAIIASSGAVITASFEQCPTIHFPEVYLESIFNNMLTNSIKYAQPGLPPHITIKSYMDNNKPMLEFTDNGIGINLKQHGDKMFGLYKVFTKHTDSHGVGLYIVKNQVEAQGGTIEVKSQLGKGTTFTICFAKA